VVGLQVCKGVGGRVRAGVGEGVEVGVEEGVEEVDLQTLRHRTREAGGR